MTIDERRIEELARKLGANRAARVDADRTAAAVLARLRTQRGHDRRWWVGLRALRVAAAVMLVVGTGVVLTQGRKPSMDTIPFAVPVALQALGSGELTEVLDTLDSEAPISEFVSGELVELSESELQELLAIMEG